MSLYADRMRVLGTENAFKIGPHILKVESAGNKVVRLNLGEPDYSIPSFVKEEAKRQLDLNNTHYCDPKGVVALRTAIANQVERTRGLHVSPDQVVVFPGGKPSIGFAQQVYCNPGDEVIYPSPGFPIYESFVEYVGASPVPLHLHEEAGFSLNASQIESLITPRTKLIILNFPSNPTGGVATKEQLQEIAAVIMRKCKEDVRVYSDEIYEYILFDGRKHFSIASVPGMAPRTIISSGFSKTIAWSGGRLGYAVFPTIDEANTFRTLNINYFSCVPPFLQEAAKLTYEHPDALRVIGEMVKAFEKRRDVIVDELNAVPGVHCHKPGGAFYLFPNISGLCQRLGAIEAFERLPSAVKQRTSPAGLFQMFALYQHHVAVMDRNSFGKIGAEGLHYLRLSIASDLPALQEGVKRIRAAGDDTSGFKAFIQDRAAEVV